MADLTLDDLDPDEVLQAESFLTTFLKEQFPSMDLSEGRVLRELLIRPAALFHVYNQTELSRLRRSMSIQAIEEDPTLADDAQVNAVLSNFKLTRNAGTKATGQVTVVISRRLTTTVPANTIFTLGTATFKTARSFVGVTTAEAAAINPESQRQIFARGVGQFSFVIDVEAVSVGEISRIRRNSVFEDVDPAPPGHITSFATQDFEGGSAAQTNAELVEAFKLAVSPKVFSGRTHIESMVKDLVPGTKAVSTIGFGDAEMLRDRHNIFAVSQGGKADIYARTASFPISKRLTKVPTLISSITKVWQVEILREDAPGLYRIESILPFNSDSTLPSMEITEEVRDLDLSVDDNEYVPDIQNLIEGAYSSYQTVIVKFIDADSKIDVDDPQVDVYVQGMPDIKTLQDRANNRGYRNPQADYLVRAPVPAYLAMQIKVQYASGVDEPDAAAIKESIVESVNNINYTLGSLPVSLIHDAIHNAAGSKGIMVAAPADVICNIHKPAGTTLTIRSSENIEIPFLPAEGVTSRTTLFMVSTSDIDLTIEKVAVLPV